MEGRKPYPVAGQIISIYHGYCVHL